VNNQPAIIIQEKVQAPHLFVGNIHSESTEANVLAEIRKAAENGIHLFCLFLELPVDPEANESPAEEARLLIESVLHTDPDAWVILRTVFKPVGDWSDVFPSAVYRNPDGSLAEPSMCADDWWEQAATALKRLIADLGKSDVGHRVVGYHLDRAEWFRSDQEGYDTSPAALDSFRAWVKDRYFGDIVALRASWFDGDAEFNRLQIPDFRERTPENVTLLTERKERPWVDYHDFLSDATVQRIGALARVVKETTKGAALVACNYGYTFEFAHPYSGHLSLARLLKCPDVDIVCGPPSYRTRLPGGAAPFPGPIDAVPLAGKLYISEEDFKTTLCKPNEPDEFNPKFESPAALEAAQLRGIGMALAHTNGVSWVDTWGNGWLNSPSVWQRAGEARSLWTKRLATVPPDPEVAVLIDERSMTMLGEPTLCESLIEKAREAVLRSGVSAGFYLLSDLTQANFPNCKLYLFLNAWDIGAQVRSAIKEKLHRGGKTLTWWYGAALMEYHRPALDRVREVAGVALKVQPFASRPGTTITHRKHPLTEGLQDEDLTSTATYEPTYSVIEEDVDVLGAYTDSSLASFALREVKAPGGTEVIWRSVFLGEPHISPTLIRNLARVAGVRIWNDADDVTYVRPPFLSVHTARSGRRTIELPDGWIARDAIGGSVLDAGSYTAQEGSTRAFLIGTPEEVASLETATIPDAPPVVIQPIIREPRQPRQRRPKAEPAPIFHLDVEPGLEEAASAPPQPEPERRPRRARAPRPTRRPITQETPPPPPVQEEPGMEVTFRFRKKS